MLTARPAEVFALSDRGRLAPGLAGDVVVFDADKIGCSRLRRVNDLPSGADRLVADAYGIDAVIVNGQVIREQDATRSRRTGRCRDACCAAARRRPECARGSMACAPSRLPEL